jgi:aspartyl-tRNA(Asn)/glutamyl-tRNA(Gln) amidotransferase subunit C
MKVSKKEVGHIAQLARLGLTEQEKEKFSYELSTILDYVRQLNKVNTKNIEPIAQITGLINVMAEDKVENKPDRENLLKNAPEKKSGLIKVKSILEQK